jgi:hypothetical protein
VLWALHPRRPAALAAAHAHAQGASPRLAAFRRLRTAVLSFTFGRRSHAQMASGAAPTAVGTTAEALQRLSVSIDALDREDNRLASLDASSATEQARARAPRA